jgi:HEPN domain-containing protein
MAGNPNMGATGDPNAWTHFARLDLQWAGLWDGSPELTGGVVFHCQQAVEKYLKAFLAANKIFIRKTHDLLELYEKVRPIHDFEFPEVMLEELSELYTEERYPDSVCLNIDGSTPSLGDAQAYLSFANFVAKSIDTELASNPSTTQESL